MAKIIELILAYEQRGEGVEGDPVRQVAQLYTKDGCLVAEGTSEWDEGFFDESRLEKEK